MSHDVDVTHDEDEVFASFIFSSSGPVRIAVGSRDSQGRTETMLLSDPLPQEALLALKSALDMWYEIHAKPDDEVATDDP